MFYKKIHSIKENTEEGIRLAMLEIGKHMRDDAKKYIEEEPKTGRLYNIGRNKTHRASAPGESPANLTGRLKESIGYKTTGEELELGAKAKYSKFLEEGTSKIKPRPYLKRAIRENEKDAYNYLMQYLKQELTSGA